MQDQYIPNENKEGNKNVNKVVNAGFNPSKNVPVFGNSLSQKLLILENV